MKYHYLISIILLIIPTIAWADDHIEYVSFRDEALRFISLRDYKTAEQRIKGAEYFANSSTDQSDYNKLTQQYNRALTTDLDSARVLYNNHKYEECITLLMPLLDTKKDSDIQWWIGNSYANIKMPILAKKYLQTGVDKYNSAWCAYSLGWLYNHTNEKASLGITLKEAKDYLTKGTSATKAAYEELGRLYEDANVYDLAVENYSKAHSKYANVRISTLLLEGSVMLPDNEAVSYITNAANDGDINSIYWLGLIYYTGAYGVTPDHTKGRSLIYKASQQGHKQAKSTLSKLSN